MKMITKRNIFFKNRLSRFTILFLSNAPTIDHENSTPLLETFSASHFSMQKKLRQTCAKRQGYCVSAKLTLEEYVKLEELVTALGTNRSAWIRELIQASISMPKNNGKTAQPPP
jgi:hypothetical protein